MAEEAGKFDVSSYDPAKAREEAIKALEEKWPERETDSVARVALGKGSSKSDIIAKLFNNPAQ